ncbi:MAG TPA: hypothetical protein VN512_05935 [Clostridia bacterium]|nr:hypothetical protein [Clostridia bacterium]
MKLAVLSYSLTGNNDALAEHIAKELNAKHIRITELQKRTNGTITADLIFGKTPVTAPNPQVLSEYDFIILAAPVWMSQPAFPLRAYLKHLKEHPKNYAYVSISGGAMNANPGLASALKKRTGYAPLALIDLHIADLLPAEPKPTAQATSAYRLTAGEIEKLTQCAVSLLKENLPK